MKETHIVKIGNESHFFTLIEEGHLKSHCGLQTKPDYKFQNLKNVFHTDWEFDYYIENTKILFCDICRHKYK
ncbi:hypothetical protein, partial [Leptospira bourretii]|uniref:hypothetical protein n=1 Tax=Leptospira bourretii TaxID=2484962 RepID=UPI001AEFB854